MYKTLILYFCSRWWFVIQYNITTPLWLPIYELLFKLTETLRTSSTLSRFNGYVKSRDWDISQNSKVAVPVSRHPCHRKSWQFLVLLFPILSSTEHRILSYSLLTLTQFCLLCSIISWMHLCCCLFIFLIPMLLYPWAILILGLSFYWGTISHNLNYFMNLIIVSRIATKVLV